MKLGQVVHLVFDDHCMGGKPGEPIVCEVFGRIVEKNEKYVTVASWLEYGGKVDDNSETFTIVRSTIKKVRVLK